MTTDQFVVLGLARVRSSWFRDLSQWSNSGSIPLQFVKCLSADEVRARLDSSRAYSALLIDGGLPALDRDLVDSAREAGCAVIVVDHGTRSRMLSDLDLAAVLSDPLDPDVLLATLRDHAHPVGRVDIDLRDEARPTIASAEPGTLVAVTGAGGSGTSTCAMAIAQAIGHTASHGSVLLADLALHADQALLHGATQLVPGVPELIEAHRFADPPPDEIRALTYSCPDRGYDLLLGIRRHRDWTAVRPRAFDAGLRSLGIAYDVVVADLDGDLEGADDTGSVDVEERNHLSRRTVHQADVVVVTAAATLSGLVRAATIVDAAVRLGVDPRFVVPIVTRAPRSPRQRSEITRAFAELTAPLVSSSIELPSPVFAPDKRNIDLLVRDEAPLPSAYVRPLGAVVEAIAGRAAASVSRGDPEPIAVVPGSLGAWSAEGELD